MHTPTLNHCFEPKIMRIIIEIIRYMDIISLKCTWCVVPDSVLTRMSLTTPKIVKFKGQIICQRIPDRQCCDIESMPDHAH